MIGGFPRPRKTTAGEGRLAGPRALAYPLHSDGLSHPLRHRGHGGTHCLEDAMIHEYRAYYIMPGRMPDIQTRSRVARSA